MSGADTKPLKKVAIVGFASHWVAAPFDDSEFEIWSLNEAYDLRFPDGSDPWLKAGTERRLRWFEVHGREEQYDGNPFVHTRSTTTEHAAKMTALNCTVYMQKHWDDIPNSVAYPLDAMIAKYGGYFTNSISYMLALAIDEGFKEIHVYGVDMAQGTEYAAQRPSCEYFLGMAQAMGVRVRIPPASDLLKASYLYGWEQPKIDAFRTKFLARKAELQKRLNDVRAQKNQLAAAEHQLMGALEDIEYTLGVWT